MHFLWVVCMFTLCYFLSMLCILQVLGSIEDERTILNVSSMKNKIHNHLTEHWPLVTSMFTKEHYTLTSFSYNEVVLD